MMDEYCVYYNGKMVGDICDNTLLLPDAERSYPYEGAKTLMLVVDELPVPKKKK